ncbi:MAG: DUF4365 domain-containing protein [Pseudanabaenaceae cyanobacterium bins.39]|nr:DUF4365 domain-containing protein [Pseudanabaenaceae cyanobacterium bins.39]
MRVSTSDQQGDSGVYALGQKVSQNLGWIFRPQPLRDIGIDAQIEIVENGESTAELLAIQIKSGKSWFDETTEKGIVFRGDPKHLEYWINYPLPVLVILHEPQTNIAYWQVVNADTVTNTGKGWKIIIPFNQKLDQASKNSLKDICRLIVHADNFSLLSLKDMSHGGAKRYTSNVLVHGSTSKADIISVVKKVTCDLITREYYRNELVRQSWENTPAKVIWLFVYVAIGDVGNANWICRSQWINSNLESQFRPIEFSGIEIGEGIVLEWSERYEELAHFYKSNTLTKEEFLDKTLHVLEKIKKLVGEITKLRSSYDDGLIDQDLFNERMKSYETDLTKAYYSSIGFNVPPLECKDFASKFSCVLADAHNIVLPFSENGLETWEESNRNYLMKQAIKDYERDLPRLEYELEKLQ